LNKYLVSSFFAFCVFSALVLARYAHAGGIFVLNNDAHFPEGPVWYRGKLYYVEYDRNTVFSVEKGCGESAVAPTSHGEFVTTCYDNGSIGRMSADRAALPADTHDKDGKKFMGPDDLAPAAHGRIYFTASGHLGPVIDGKVFYIAADGTITQVAIDLYNSNGLGGWHDSVRG
jgi:sugar lactone lactonase YvrE